MPIRREYRFFYPIDWPQLSAVIRFGRAKGRCEGCGRPHGQLIFHLGMATGGMQPDRPGAGAGSGRAGCGTLVHELCGRLGDDGVLKAAYRGGCRSLPEPLSESDT
ncbi:hypothetical protein ABS772_07250, partial [Methylorubrum podarium]